MASFPQKIRKRHKVATSCNRCRQNKRKCDSGIPCSNCKRNKADCLYTDAQQSRSTWGDSPLSKEKIMGVSTADPDMSSASAAADVNSSAAASTASGMSPTTTPMSPTGVKASGKHPSRPSSVSKVPAAAKNPPMTTTVSSKWLFNPGHTSTQQADALDRRTETLEAQSKQIAKAIRVARPGPQLDLSDLFPDKNDLNPAARSSAALAVSAHIKESPYSVGPVLSLMQSQDSPTTVWRQDTSSAHLSPAQDVSQQVSMHDSYRRARQASLESGSGQSAAAIHDLSGESYRLSHSGSNDRRHAPGFYLNQAMSPTHRGPISYSANTSADLKELPMIVPTQATASMGQQGYPNEAQRADCRISVSQATQSPHYYSTHLSPLQQQWAQRQHQRQSSSYSEPEANLNHALSSAAPVSSDGISSQIDAPTAWTATSTSAHYLEAQLDWRESGDVGQQPAGPSQRSPPLHQEPLLSSPVHITPAQHYHDVSSRSQSYTGSQPTAESDALRMRKIAKDMLDCKKYDYCIMLPRHISQDYDELWVTPQSDVSSSLQGIPRQLLILPKDANFLVDVFFEHSCFYYPIVNRAAVELQLMDPQTPHALFLLNIVFMAACKHLARQTDIKRAIQFRERARVIRQYVDGKARLTRLQSYLMGSQVIYGVFVVAIGMAQLCGTYKPLPLSPDDSAEESQVMFDLAAESQSLAADKGLIPEAAYQQRLWTFWGFYTRDSMSRLYFGWPHGLDSVAVTAELPKVKGTIGLGGMRKNLSGQNPATGKRSGPAMKKGQAHRDSKLMRAEVVTVRSDRDMYRRVAPDSEDDDDDDSDIVEEEDDESDLEQDEFQAGNASGSIGAAESDRRFKYPIGTEYSHTKVAEPVPTKDSTSSGSTLHGKEETPLFTGISKHLLERQSRGEDLALRPGNSGADVKRHLDRMRLLLDAESDVTDGETYSRVLFLEEIKLWMIGRRVGLYLQSRSTSLSVNPAAIVAVGSYSPLDAYGAASEGGNPTGSTISASTEASHCSERAWLEDKQLQGLQADLIAWEQDLPPLFKFRPDVDAQDINHKVNGKMAVLTMYYYTITIMLQSSYLPTPQYISPALRSFTHRSPETISQEYDCLFSRAGSMTGSEDSGVRIKKEAEEYPGWSPKTRTNGYFNTAHQICTQLSNVLYHHVELLLDRYTDWCSIQCKLNQSLTAALRVSCLNARLSSNSKAIRDEAKAGFKMGSDLFKRQAVLPAPLTVRDWPAEEDVQVMLDLEEEFRELMMNQEEEQLMAHSIYDTRDSSEGFGIYEDPGDHLLYPPEQQSGSMGSLQQGFASLDPLSTPRQDQQAMFPAEHVFGLSEEGFQFDYSMNA
ncbi:hypothetical protein EDD11_000725 [Mortierella claussenii]|nr:hypothetical protein EDD11_000725 [Mortierella claussenii]